MSGILCAHFGGSAPELVLNLSNLATPNISSRLSSAGWDGVAPVRLVVDPSALLNTLVIPTISFPNGLYLLNGADALIGGRAGYPGSAAGYALYTRVPISIENHGSIKGGGAAGGRGGSASVTRFGSTSSAGGGDGGNGQGFSNGVSLTIVSSTTGYAGDSNTNTTAPGPGEWIVGDTGSATANGGKGGRGGNWRQPGYSGSSGSVSGSYSSATANPGQAGSPAGLNIDGIEYVTWIVRGDA